MVNRELTPALKIYRLVSLLDVPALCVGSIGAALGHRWGAYLLIANLIVQIGAHLVVGVTAYNGAMAQPWPKVEPLVDDA